LTEFTVPFDGDISDSAISEWLQQFQPDERKPINKLIPAFKYYSYKTINVMLRSLHEKVLSSVRLSSKILYVPLGYIAKSGDIFAHLYRKENNLTTRSFLDITELTPTNLRSYDVIVFLDDLICTGGQAEKFWNQLQLILNKENAPQIILAVAVGFESGLKHVKASTGFKVIVADLVKESDMPFSESSMVFESKSEQKNARDIAEKYGWMLCPKHPLGYNCSQALIGFFYATPNNTLPIFWSTNNWKPLLPHGGESVKENAACGGEWSIFISYSSSGSKFARALKDFLRECRVNAFLDDVDIPAKYKETDEWNEIKNRAIKNCKVFLLIMTSGFNTSEKIKSELTKARTVPDKVFTFLKEEGLCSVSEIVLENEVFQIGNQQHYCFATENELLKKVYKILI
jgi:hypothetical protein